MAVRIIHGDCLSVMPTLAADSVDSVVTDPPYGLSFMGKSWDHGVPSVPFWIEALRVAKPGAYLVAFGGTRTYHRLTCAIEDAGWEIRDCLSWLYGSGFPKSHNGTWGGTALKPAWEPIILARKPLIGAVAKNVEAHGTGGLNIDGCRIETSDALGGGAERITKPDQKGNDGWTRPWMSDGVAQGAHAERVRANVQKAELLGRWPANVVLDEEAGAALDLMSGSRGAAAPASGPTHEGQSTRGAMAGDFRGMNGRAPQFHNDSGGASRFFYCAKASRSEREAGLAAMEVRRVGALNLRTDAHAERTGNATNPARNHHPTVKPIALMRWLCRLTTPPGGTVLDPFAGSGTTGVAAAREGFGFIGVEKEAEYAEIALARVRSVDPLFAGAQ